MGRKVVLLIIAFVQVCLFGIQWISTTNLYNTSRFRVFNNSVALFFLSNKSSPSLRSLQPSTPPTRPNCSYEISANDSRINVNTEKISMEQVEKLLEGLRITNGGQWRPSDCSPLHRVAILIPFRNREEQLPVFLRHMHPFLQKQKLDYQIYVIEQTATSPFNRGLLFNVGFIESNKQYDWQCYLLHDVDLLPEDSRNLYTCPWSNPRHMVVAHGGNGYSLLFETYFGGVSEMTRSQYEKTNGFSNFFFGWGGEDDDLYARVTYNGYKIMRYPAEIGRYTALTHKAAEPAEDRFKMLETGKARFATDGLNNMKYKLQTTNVNKLYTRFIVDIDKNSVLSRK